MYVMFYSESVS